MHWLDVTADAQSVETRTEIRLDKPIFTMAIMLDDFAVPSWNRMLAMHHMTKNRLIRLTEARVREALCGHEWAVPIINIEYEALTKPTKGRKELVKQMRQENPAEHEFLKKFVAREEVVKAITERPREFDGPLTLKFSHWRKRLIDVDNLCVKPLIDAIVRTGLIPDDGPKNIKQIWQAQHSTKELENHDFGAEFVVCEIEEFQGFFTNVNKPEDEDDDEELA